MTELNQSLNQNGQRSVAPVPSFRTKFEEYSFFETSRETLVSVPRFYGGNVSTWKNFMKQLREADYVPYEICQLGRFYGEPQMGFSSPPRTTPLSFEERLTRDIEACCSRLLENVQENEEAYEIFREMEKKRFDINLFAAGKYSEVSEIRLYKRENALSETHFSFSANTSVNIGRIKVAICVFFVQSQRKTKFGITISFPEVNTKRHVVQKTILEKYAKFGFGFWRIDKLLPYEIYLPPGYVDYMESICCPETFPEEERPIAVPQKLKPASGPSYQMGIMDFITKKVTDPVCDKIDSVFDRTSLEARTLLSGGLDGLLLTVSIAACGEIIYGLYTDDETYIKTGSAKLAAAGVATVVKRGFAHYQDGFMGDALAKAESVKELIVDCFSQIFSFVDIKSLTDWARRITIFDRAWLTMQKVISWLVQQLNNLSTYLIGRDLFPKTWFSKIMTTGMVKEYLKMAYEFTDGIASGNLLPSLNEYNKLALLIEAGKDLLLVSVKDSVGHPLLNAIVADLQKIRQNMITLNPSFDLVRPEPSTLLLRGAPANGKTVMSKKFASALTMKSFPDPASAPVPHFRNPQNQYFDGYVTGTHVVIMDDFGQSRDVAGSLDNEYFTFFCMVNTIPYMLHMAELRDKGKTFFKASYVIGTTNILDFRPESITSAEALNRRWHVDVIVYPKPEWCKDPKAGRMEKRLDREKVLAAGKILDESLMIFFDRRTQLEMTYEEVLALVIKNKEDRESWCSEELSVMKKETQVPKEVTKNGNFILRKSEIVPICMEELEVILEHQDNLTPDTILECASTITKMRTDRQSSLTSFCNPLTIRTSISKYLASIPKDYTTGLIGSICIALPLISLFYYNDTRPDYQSVEIHLKKKNQPEIARKITPQMGFAKDPSGIDLLTSIVRRNMFTLTSGETKFGYILGIKGYVAICNKHFFAQLQLVRDEKPELGEEGYVTLSRYDRRDVRKWDFSVDEFLGLKRFGVPDSDLSFVVFPPRMERFKDITKNFKTGSPLKKFNDAVLLNWNSKKDFPVLEQMAITAEYVRDYRLGKDKIEEAYVYRADTQNGDCGCLVADLNPRIQSEKIIGIHMGGGTGLGSCIRVTQEIILTYLKKFSVYETSIEQEAVLDYQMGDFPFSSTFVPVAEGVKINQIGGSSFVKTPYPFFELFGEALEFPTDCRTYKLGESLIDYNVSSFPTINQKLLEEAIEAESDFIYSNSRVFVEDKILTSYEVVRGLEAVESSKLSRSTSPGYSFDTVPFVLQRGKLPGKEYWLGSDELPCVENEHWSELELLMEKRKSSMMNGIRPTWPFMMNLKDEIRKKGKKPRIFGAGPLDNLVLCGQHFGSFGAWYLANRIDNGSTLGVNVFSPEWDRIAKLFPEWVLSMDFASFDKKPPPAIVQGLIAIFERFYKKASPEERLIRKFLIEDCFKPYYYIEGKIYKSHCGLPSGHYLTAILNTLLGRISHRMAYAIVWNDYGAIRRYSTVKSIQNGDDCLIGTNEEEKDVYNERSVSEAMLTIGFDCTSDTKDGTFNLRRINEVHYLKRGFRFDEVFNRFVAPLKMSRLKEFTNWTKKKKMGSLY